jgi:hypothetical protein
MAAGSFRIPGVLPIEDRLRLSDFLHHYQDFRREMARQRRSRNDHQIGAKYRGASRLGIPLDHYLQMGSLLV